MRKLLFIGCLACAGAVGASTSISNVQASPRDGGRAVRIAYTLANEPAVVTLGLYEKATGAYIGEGAYTNLSGDVNCLVQPGRRFIVWTKDAAWTRTDGDVDVRLRAWTTNCPPDYLVFNLTDRQQREQPRYYVSTNAFPAPLADSRYRTTHLVMRKIPAANVEFRMGTLPNDYRYATTTTDRYREQTHWTRLTEDYYLGVYPVTYAQHCNAMGQSKVSKAFWGESGCERYERYESVRRDDWPICHMSYTELRSFAHEDGSDSSWPRCQGASVEGYVDYKYWYRDGHQLDTNNTSRCACRGGASGTKLTFALNTWRANYGYLFDLPTEAQWEFACRAGTDGSGYYPTTVADRSGSSFVTDLDKYAWTIRNSTNETINLPTPHPVGEKLPNGFGLYDMLGNVAEWCLDICTAPTADSSAVEVDPAGIGPKFDFGVSRSDAVAKRGGYWLSRAEDVRPAARHGICPFYANVDFMPDAAAKKALPTEVSWAMGYRLWLPANAVR